jgi:hypothetical protein
MSASLRFSDLVVVAAHSLPDAEGGTKRKLQRSETPPASRPGTLARLSQLRREIANPLIAEDCGRVFKVMGMCEPLAPTFRITQSLGGLLP